MATANHNHQALGASNPQRQIIANGIDMLSDWVHKERSSHVLVSSKARDRSSDTHAGQQLEWIGNPMKPFSRKSFQSKSRVLGHSDLPNVPVVNGVPRRDSIWVAVDMNSRRAFQDERYSAGVVIVTMTEDQRICRVNGKVWAVDQTGERRSLSCIEEQ